MSGKTPAAALSACQRCKIAKRRCDRGHPKCSGCRKANAACIVVDPVTSKRYARQYISELESEERVLLERVYGDGSTPQSVHGSSAQAATDRAVRALGTTSELPKTASEFVGDNGGSNLLRSIFSSEEWVRHGDVMLKEASERTQMTELNTTVNDAPSFEEASALLNNYFSRFHIHHSFLLKSEVFATFAKVYSSDPSTGLPQDWFRLFMIFAISAVTRYREGLSRCHPYGYYLGGLRWIGQVSLLGCADAVQNLLLVARFGMYYHVGKSLWDISQSCMRQCVHLEYYRPSARFLSPFEEQKRRRIFWECYILDRYSSTVLGRPFAIADHDISVDLPVAANDEAIQASPVASLSDIAHPALQTPNELSVFVFCIKLRRISSQVRTDFYSMRRPRSQNQDPALQDVSAAGHAQVKADRYIHELECWRLEAPVFPKPVSLYERPEWYDFLLEADKLALLRAAMHASPKRRHNKPPARLLRLSLESAARAIGLYAGMLEQRLITWTRNYFQTIFLAGISIIYCLSLETTETDHMDDIERYRPTLEACSSILDVFRREMPDASFFATIFTETKRQLLPKGTTYHSGAQDECQRTQEAAHNQQDEQTAAETSWAPSSNLLSPTFAGPAMGSFQPATQDVFLSDDIMQSIEAGLGQYACGFLTEDLFNFELPDMEM